MARNRSTPTRADADQDHTWHHARARLAGHTRHHGPDDPHVPELRRDLRAARLEDHVRKVISEAPPLTDDQVKRLRALLPPPTPERIRRYRESSDVDDGALGGDAA